MVVVMTAAATLAVFVIVMMTAAAALAVFVVVVMTAAATLAMFVVVVAATFAAVFAATAAAFTAHHVDETLYFFVCSVALRYYLAFEVQVLAGQWMIEVNDYGAFFHFKHKALEMVAVGVHQRQHSTGINHVFVETAVHAERFLGQFEHMLFFVGAVSLVLFENKVECVALFQTFKLCLEGFERHAHACYKLKGMFYRSFLNQFVNALLVVGKEFVCYCNILVWSLFHTVL